MPKGIFFKFPCTSKVIFSATRTFKSIMTTNYHKKVNLEEIHARIACFKFRVDDDK